MVVAQVLSLQELVQVRLHEVLHNISAQVNVKESTARPSHSHGSEIGKQGSVGAEEEKRNTGLEKYCVGSQRSQNMSGEMVT